MGHAKIVLHVEVSDDVGPEAVVHDQLAGQFSALAEWWSPDSIGRRYLDKLAGIHRAKAQEIMQPKKLKRARKV